MLLAEHQHYVVSDLLEVAEQECDCNTDTGHRSLGPVLLFQQLVQHQILAI